MYSVIAGRQVVGQHVEENTCVTHPEIQPVLIWDIGGLLLLLLLLRAAEGFITIALRTRTPLLVRFRTQEDDIWRACGSDRLGSGTCRMEVS